MLSCVNYYNYYSFFNRKKYSVLKSVIIKNKVSIPHGVYN